MTENKITINTPLVSHSDWRSKWHEGTGGETDEVFPFGFVQLASYIATIGVANVRWGQTAGYGRVPNPLMPNTFDAAAIDLVDLESPHGSVHIRDKPTVASRLSLGGLAVAYNVSTYCNWQGPVATAATSVKRANGDSEVVVTFTNVGADGLELRNETGWEVCQMSMTNANQNCSVVGNTSVTPGVGSWSFAKVVGTTGTTVSVSGPTGWNAEDGKLVVRYAWAAITFFDYKNAGVYAKSENLPTSTFIIVVQ
jgi:sialate O-acetylesterase